MKFAIHHGDVLEVLKKLEDNSFDGMLSDPPYHLKLKGSDNKGFMGSAWDGGDVAHRPEVWAEALRVLKPGAFGLIFGGTRTFHRLAVAVEDAGFELRDMCVWLYAQGMPKSFNLSKVLDKAAGIDTSTPDWTPTTLEAQHWDGYASSLRPSYEPILVVQKPFKGTYAENIKSWDVGGLNIDGCRIETDDNLNGGAYTPGLEKKGSVYQKFDYPVGEFKQPAGRWPSNVLWDEEAAEELDEIVGPRKSGSRKAGVRKGMGFHGATGDGGRAIEGSVGGPSRYYFVSKASKSEKTEGLEKIETILVQLNSWENEVQEATLLVDTAQLPPKVIGVSMTQYSDVNEWNTFLFGSGITDLFQRGCRFTIAMEAGSITDSRTLSWLTQQHTSAFTRGANSETASGSSPAQPVESSSQSRKNIGTSAKRDGPSTDGAVLATLPELLKKSKSVKLRSEGCKGVRHLTVKPQALVTYLAKLILPPKRDTPRRLLTPFSGVSSEMLGGLKAGWEEVIGIELESEYVNVGKMRLTHYIDQYKKATAQ